MKTSRNRRGFTLVELMVSLVAGLIVTIAVVGIARAATTTFYEAARISSTEGAVRTASERLRQDLSRAAYMGTGNIKLSRDGQAAVQLSQKIAVSDPTNATTGSRYAALNNLQGVHIVVGGSGNFPIVNAGTAGPNNLSSNNALNPDSITIGGNFTTDDSYQGRYSTVPGTCGGSQIVTLNAAGDAAVRRLLLVPNPLATLQAAFYPAPPSLQAARIVDETGCQHYVVVVGVDIVGSNAVICLAPDDGGNASVIASGAGGANCGETPEHMVSINPVQTVRWYIGPNTDPTLAPASGTEVPGNKFNLYRDFLDASPAPAPIAASRQVVAEFAVDLKFGVTALDSANHMQVYEMDTEVGGGGGNIESYTQNAAGTLPGQPGPQRVRSVRYRIATRTALADRDSPLASGASPFLTRYCVQNSPSASCKSFARARTLVSEVTLLNQLGMTY